MRTRQVELALHTPADLGEGPWWDEERSELLWVDIFAGDIHRFNPRTGRDRSINVGQPVSMAAVREAGGLVCAVRDGIGFVDEDSGNFTLAIPVELERTGNRMNDGACDPAGRLWAGTMATDLSPGKGALYRIGTGLESTRILDGVSISNGLDWSPDGKTFYHIDSSTRRIDAYDFDFYSGGLSRGRTLAELPDAIATPDGMAVDTDGTLWVAMWDGGCIRRYSPRGDLLEVVELPVSRPTSVAFGGTNMNKLYVTSARNGLTRDQLASEPLAGSLFVLDTGSTGLPPHPFLG